MQIEEPQHRHVDVSLPETDVNNATLTEVSFRQPASFSTRILVH